MNYLRGYNGGPLWDNKHFGRAKRNWVFGSLADSAGPDLTARNANELSERLKWRPAVGQSAFRPRQTKLGLLGSLADNAGPDLTARIGSIRYNVFLDICGQRRPRSDCAFARSGQGLCCRLTKLLDAEE